MTQLEIKSQNQGKDLVLINKLVEYIKNGYLPTLRIEKKDDDLIVAVEWQMQVFSEFDKEFGEELSDWVIQRYLLSYKVEGLKDLIGSFLDDYTTTNLDAKLSDYTKTDGSNITDDISNKLMSHHTAQVFDFLSALDIQYNVFGTEG